MRLVDLLYDGHYAGLIEWGDRERAAPRAGDVAFPRWRGSAGIWNYALKRIITNLVDFLISLERDISCQIKSHNVDCVNDRVN